MFTASTLAWSEPLSRFIPKAHELGFSGVEVWAEHLWQRADEPRSVRGAAEDLGMELSVHGPSWDLNLCALDRRMIEASRECSKRAVELAGVLGAKILVVHPGRHSLGGYFKEYHWRELQQSYVELCALAGERGVQIAVEAMEKVPKEFLCDAEIVNRFVAEVRDRGVENIGVVVDMAHLTTLSDDPMGYLQKFERVIELHASNVRSEKLHTPIDEGDLDLTGILPLLQRDFELPIVIEGISTDPGFAHLERTARALGLNP